MANIMKSEQPREGALARGPRRGAVGPFEEMDRMFEGFFNRMFPRGWMNPLWEPGSMAGGLSPRVDIIDQDDNIVIRAEMPGVKKEDIDVSTTDHTVTIRGTTHEEEKQEKGDFYRCEMAHGELLRTVSLPADVDEEHAHAKLENGILELVLPKREASKRKSIKVE